MKPPLKKGGFFIYLVFGYVYLAFQNQGGRVILEYTKP
jgi:hypothetical protein